MVNQTISGLACGRPIRGKVAFLGGPLTFISALRDRFQETLSIADEDMIIPEHGELYVAIGAAVSAMHDRPLDLERWLSDVRKKTDVDLGSSKTMDPLLLMKRSTAASRSATPVSMRRGEISRTRRAPAGSA